MTHESAVDYHFEERRLRGTFLANMAARIWMYSVVFFVIFVLGVNANKPKIKSGIKSTKDGKTVIVEGNNNAVSLGNDKKIKTALTQIQERLKSLEEKVSLLVSTKPGASVGPKTCRFDFEHGIHTWTRTGTVFNNQPTYGDNSGARGSHRANQQGDWWIGGYENRPSKAVKARTTQGDGPQGTLTSPSFRITGKHISFLIGGGCDIKTVRAELIVGHKVVKSITGACSDTMTRKVWNVHAFIGQRARVKLIDFDSGSWGHINFDDLKGDISCV